MHTGKKVCIMGGLTVESKAESVYSSLGVRPAINAAGPRTVMGGSRVSPAVQAAADMANRHFVVMEDLQRRTGELVAERLGSEMGLVTPGCAAAMTLSVAALMTGTDPEKIAQIPDTTGMKDEIIIQKCQRYNYDRALTLCGAKLVEVGDENGATEADVEAAINDQTLAIHYLAVEFHRQSLTFEALRDIAHGHDLPLIVDAACVVYPLEQMRHYPSNGADLVCYGAKYFGSFHGTGLLVGKRKYLEAAHQHTFVSFEVKKNRAFGRPLKLDRQDVVATMTALEEWWAMDHEERLAELEARGQIVMGAVADMPFVSTTWATVPSTVLQRVELQVGADSPKTLEGIQAELKHGDISIETIIIDDALHLVMNQLYEGEAEIIAARLQEILIA